MTMRTDIPAEAVSINGLFIEDAISGYTTIKTEGREGLPINLNTYDVGTANGERIKSSRYPARTIKVNFHIHGTSMNDMREKLNHLNNILAQDEADFVFNDEDDKFFTGTPIMQTDVTDYKNSMSGTFEIYCAYPFKRSVAVKVATPTTVHSTDAEFTIAYGGNYPAKPILRAEFAGALSGGNWSDDGDCGFVAWTDADENIVQVGNTEAIELDPSLTAGQVANHDFVNTTGWSTSGGATWGSKAVTGSVTANTSITDANWGSGAGQTMKFAVPTYGSNSGWHGPILHYTVSGGMVNYDIVCKHRMAVSANAQCGSFELGAYNIDNGTYKLLTGFVIEKSANGTAGTVRYIVNGTQVGTDSIDLSYYNTNFGYCNKTAVYTTQKYTVTVKKKVKGKKKTVKETRTRSVLNGYKYSQSNLNSSITKAGAVVTFKVGGLAARNFTVADVENMQADNISMHFGQNGTVDSLNTNAVSNLKCTKKGGPAFTDYQNTFTSGDVVEADCNDATVTLYRADTEAGDGQLVPQFGALGNDWEDFCLRPNSSNTIAVTWSPWVNSSYKPTFKILYNEVFL